MRAMMSTRMKCLTVGLILPPGPYSPRILRQDPLEVRVSGVFYRLNKQQATSNKQQATSHLDKGVSYRGLIYYVVYVYMAG